LEYILVQFPDDPFGSEFVQLFMEFVVLALENNMDLNLFYEPHSTSWSVIKQIFEYRIVFQDHNAEACAVIRKTFQYLNGPISIGLQFISEDLLATIWKSYLKIIQIPLPDKANQDQPFVPIQLNPDEACVFVSMLNVIIQVIRNQPTDFLVVLLNQIFVSLFTPIQELS
jgi:hypothetical protein